MAVAYDNSATAQDFSVTTLTTGAFTVGAGANRVALLELATTAAPGTITAISLGGVSGIAIASAAGNDGNWWRVLYKVINPPSGSQTATVTWTNSASGVLSVITATGAQDANNGNYAQNAAATVAIAITSNAGDLTATFDGDGNVGSSHTTSQTLRIPGVLAGGDTGPGTAGPITHTWTNSGAFASNATGANFQAASSASPRLANIAGPGKHPGPRSFAPLARGYPVVTAATSAIEGTAAAITISAAQLAGAGALLGSAVHATTSAGVLAGSGSLAGAVVTGVVAAGNLKGTANAAGAAITAAIMAGQLTGQGALLGAAVTATLAAGVAAGAGALQGAAVSTVVVAGLLADFSPANLVGASVVGAFAAGSLSGAGALTGASAVSVLASGQLGATGILAGASIAGSFAAGLLSAQDAGAITASSVSFVTAAGVLVSLTPAIPEVTGGHRRGGKRTFTTPRQAEDRLLDALTRDMEFENPVFHSVEAPREVSVEPVFTAELTPAVVQILAERDATRRRVLTLLLLMAQMDD